MSTRATMWFIDVLLIGQQCIHGREVSLWKKGQTVVFATFWTLKPSG